MRLDCIGILDLCKKAKSASASQSILGMVRLARFAEKAGYGRYWVSEHHSGDASHSSPEVLIPLLCAQTSRIRVGSGGLLLRYQSPLKVAETFLTLEAMFPSRIDLGVCKGPGVASPLIAEALVCGNTSELTDESLEQKTKDLVELVRNSPGARPRPVSLCPRSPEMRPPELWVLGSGSKSGNLAARLGVPYGFTCFFDPGQKYGHNVITEYCNSFQPSSESPKPRCLIAVSMVCMESDESAEKRHNTLIKNGFLESNIVGGPGKCVDELQKLAASFHPLEIELLIATWLRDPEEREAMYGALAGELGLTGLLAAREPLA